MIRIKMIALLLVGAALVLFGTTALAAPGGKAKVELSYELYGGGSFVVDYEVHGKSGKMDLAVSHQCFLEGELVQSRTNRLYWSGRGQDKAGHWELNVGAGNECFAVVVDLAQSSTSSGSESLAPSGYAEVSAQVSYMVE